MGVETELIDTRAHASIAHYPSQHLAAHVLLADSNVVCRDQVQQLLPSDYRVAVLSNAQEALDYALANRPDVILLSSAITHPDGFSFIQALRNDPHTAAIPVLMLSAETNGAADGSLDAGADDYISAPFSTDELTDRIEAHVAMARLRNEFIERERNLYGQAQLELHERAQIEIALRESEQRHRQLIEGLPAAIYACDAKGRLTMFNQAAADLWGRKPALHEDSWCGSWRIYQPEGTLLPPDQCPMAIAMREGRAVYGAEILVERPDGSRRWVLPHPRPIRDAAGNVVGAINMLVDITERKQAEAELAATKSDLSLQVTALTRLHDLAMRLAGTPEPRPALQAILETLVDVHGADLGLLSLYDSTTGLLRDDAHVGFDDVTLQLLAKIKPEPNIGARGSAFATRQRVVVEDTETDPRFVDLRESTRAAGVRAVHSTPILTRSGEILGVLSVQFRTCRRPTQCEMQLADLCARHAADAIEVANNHRAARESEERFTRFMQHLPGLAWIKDTSGKYVFANEAATKAFQVGISNLLGKSDTDVFSPETAAQFQEHDRTALASESGIQTVEMLEQPDGVHYSLVNKFAIPDSDGTPALVGGMAIDITDHKRAEEALRESEARFRTLASHAPVGIFQSAPNGGTIFVNEQWCAMAGLTCEQAMGEGWLAAVHPEDRAQVSAGWQEAVRTGLPSETEFRFQRADGEVTWLQGNAIPLYNATGQLAGYIGTVADITTRKQSEETLKEADRRKDEFLAVLAHELRNPLAPIRTGLELMRLAGDDQALNEEVRATMERQVQQMVRLIDDLMDVSRITRGTVELRKSRVELSTVVESAVETARPVIDEWQHKLNVSLPHEPIILEADPTRLAQAISNLLNNAAKYMKRKGTVDLTAHRQGKEVVISVKDSGIGIPTDMLDNIFEMFTQVDRSLERSHSGLGIGLTLVKRLIGMHGGTVEAASAGPNLGSEFTIRLPVVIGLMRVQQPPDGESVTTGRKRRVLVVDDNEQGAKVLGMLLTALGNDVRTAHDGLAAVELAAEFRPDLVLLDIGMPKLNGYEACRRIREQPWGKNTLLVALTGWGQDDDKQRSRAAGFDHHFVKPVEPAVLQKLLAECRPTM